MRTAAITMFVVFVALAPGPGCASGAAAPAAGSRAQAADPLQEAFVEMLGDGHLVLDGTDCLLTGLRSRMSSFRPASTRVVLKPRPRVAYGEVQRVIDVLLASGFDVRLRGVIADG